MCFYYLPCDRGLFLFPHLVVTVSSPIQWVQSRISISNTFLRALGLSSHVPFGRVLTKFSSFLSSECRGPTTWTRVVALSIYSFTSPTPIVFARLIDLPLSIQFVRIMQPIRALGIGPPRDSDPVAGYLGVRYGRRSSPFSQMLSHCSR